MLLLPLTSGGFRTVDEYLEAAKAKHENTVYYATDKAAQAQYISMFESEGIEVALLDKVLDTQYINVIESDRNVKFVRIDADVADALKGDGEKYENKALEELFKKVSGSDRLTVRCEALRDESVPALLNISEQTRRMDDMMRMYRMSGGEDGGMSMPLERDARAQLEQQADTRARRCSRGGCERAQRACCKAGIYACAARSETAQCRGA